MKRVLSVALILALAVAAALFAGARQDSGAYRVRATFDSAAGIDRGMFVKVSGVVVGVVEAVSVDWANEAHPTASVRMRIDREGFQGFRTDARCRVRPESLLGDRYIDCRPTTPHRDVKPRPPLPRNDAGEAVLPLKNTSSPVDFDIVMSTLRLPYPQRLAIILNELGTGLAGNGDRLRETIRRADPALEQTDRALAILAAQRRQLASLVLSSDRLLAPLARERRRVAGFVRGAADTSEAVATRREDLARSLALLPGFLRETRAALKRLDGLTGQLGPAAADLRVASPDLNRFLERLGPLARASTPAFQSLGRSASAIRQDLPAATPTLEQTADVGRGLEPLASDLDALTESTDRRGGFARILDGSYRLGTSLNGYDALGYYLRTGLVINACAEYWATPYPGCAARFNLDGGAARTTAPAADVDDTAAGTLDYLLAP